MLWYGLLLGNIMIIHIIFKNAVNKEAINYVMLLKKKLGISVNPSIALFLAVVINDHCLYISFSVDSLPNQLQYVVIVIVIIFNLFLPSTISRRINQSQDVNPIYEAIFLATKNKKISYKILEKSDLILFWFDNIEFPIILSLLLIFEYHWIGIFWTIILVCAMNSIFVRTYKKTLSLKDTEKLNNQYFFPKIFYFLVVGFISLVFIKVIQNIMIHDLTNVSETSFFLKNLVYVARHWIILLH